jgi:hypothetical protein
MPRKERGVNIERGESRHSEDLFVEDLSITSDDEHIRLMSLEGLYKRGVTRCRWLQNVYSVLIAQRSYSATLNRSTATPRKIRAGDNEREVVTTFCYSL